MKKTFFLLSIFFICYSCKNNDNILSIQKKIPKHTYIIAHPKSNFKKNDNYIWSSTLQIAWNDFKKIIKRNIVLSNQPKIAYFLNNKPYSSKKDLNKESYITISGFKKNYSEGNLNALEKKLKIMTFDSGKSQFINSIQELNSNEAFAYCYLFKSLKFIEPFSYHKNNGILINGVKYKSFFLNKSSKNFDKLLKQVIVHSYRNDENFIIELKTKSKIDQIILAKISKPKRNLIETITMVLSKLKYSRPLPFNIDDELKIPLMNFDFTYNYSEFNIPIVSSNQDFYLFNMIQRIKFILNESWALLESEALLEKTADDNENRKEPKCLHFDKNFLIIMKLRKSQNPYFFAWIGNTNLFYKL